MCSSARWPGWGATRSCSSPATGRSSSPAAALARAFGLADHVRFLGLRDDVERVFAAADVVVMPSLWDEAFGLVVVEAMAAARPVVVTASGAMPELVAGGAGVVVPKRDEVAMAGAIGRLLDDDAGRTRMGQTARARAITRFGLSTLGRAHHGGVRGAAAGARRAGPRAEGGMIARLQALFRRVLGAGSPLVIGRLISAALTFGLPLVLARLLTPEQFGTYKQFFLIAATVQLTCQLGLTQSRPRSRRRSWPPAWG